MNVGRRVQPNPDSPFVTRWGECTGGVIWDVLPLVDAYTRQAYIVELDNGVKKHFYFDELEAVNE